MINVFMISYDLRNPNRNYDKLYAVIRSFGGYCHALDSMWFVKTYFSKEYVFTQLALVLDENDSLFVNELTKNWRGYINTDAVRWLETIKVA